MPDALVIADIHGHYDRAVDLLVQERIIDPETEQMINSDVIVAQLGDLGHFGGSSGSVTGDAMCYAQADDWFDIVLWGNHDRACVSHRHAFAGYQAPGTAATESMLKLIEKGKLKFAAAINGYLLTHAGLTKDAEKFFPDGNPEIIVEYIEGSSPHANGLVGSGYIGGFPGEPIIDAISKERGGREPFGGILWKDWKEPRYSLCKSVCGHTSKPWVRRDDSGNWCIDIGAKEGHALCGMWLPEDQTQEPRLVWIGKHQLKVLNDDWATTAEQFLGTLTTEGTEPIQL